ncbi:MAG: hypothetical protein A2Z27_05565 [candidate division Zixibacteria bacterium RBG_16_50_21]|nr:MAG: hypothetical protein A2Z27_05565 [candidate division Zixibacteria bacterium RBG_16_50_21]
MKRDLLFILFILTLAGTSAAQDFSWHGFVQANYSARTTGLSPDSNRSDFLWADHRFQLKFTASEGAARAFAKVDLFQDARKKENKLEVREAYLDYSTGSFDFRAGRQIITWGLGDLLFINDVFPKDWQAFFSGRPVEYLKLGVDGIKTTFTSSFLSGELALIPLFEPDNLPTSQDFFLHDPLSSVTNRSENKPDQKLENSEQAVRFFRNFGGFEATLYFYRGFFRSPSVWPDSSMLSLTYFYPKQTVYGTSLQKNIYNGIVSLEYGYSDSRQDREGTKPLIPNSFHKLLTGYQRQGWTDFSYTFQFYGELMEDYDEYKSVLQAAFPQQDEFRYLLTSRATQLLKYQTWKLSFFGFYSPSDNDYYLIPEVQYKFSDKLWVSVGGNVFGGEKQTTFFGQFDRNDNLTTTVRYEF